MTNPDNRRPPVQANMLKGAVDMMRPAKPQPGKIKADPPMEPTAEQRNHGRYVLEDIHDKLPGGTSITIGKGFKRKRMVESLFGQGLFTEAEAKALLHYRHHADMVDKSPTPDSLNFTRHGGNGNGPSVSIVNAWAVVGSCEKAAGALVDILRAVIVDDLSISAWAKQKHGGREQCRERKGKVVCSIEPHLQALRIAQLEVKMAAQRVEAELSA